MSCLKILQLIQKPQNRGAETFACQIARHHEAQGNEVLMVSIFGGEARLPWDGKIISLDASAKYRFFDVKAWGKLARLIRDFKPDIVQANAGDTLKYAVLSKRIYGWSAPIVFRNASEVGKYLKSNLQVRFNKFLYKNVDLVISVSSKSKSDIVDNFTFLKDKATIIPIGIEDVKAKIHPVKLIPENKKHLVHVGGFTFEKNHEGLIRIFKEVLSRNKNVHLHLIGDGPRKGEIEKLIKREGLEGHISLYGFVENPLDYIAAADILVLPSIIEGLPGVILEAMYCHTAVIAFNVGGISEIINEYTGNLIEAGAEDMFAQSIIKNIKFPNLVGLEAAYKKVCSQFMNKDVSKSFIREYENLL